MNSQDLACTAHTHFIWTHVRETRNWISVSKKVL